MYHSDIRLGATIDIKFCTVGTTGAPTVLAGTPVVSAYVDNGLVQITAGVTLTVDFDGIVGLNNVRVAATGANGFAVNTNVQLVITTGTVGGTSVVGYVVGSFSIEARPLQDAAIRAATFAAGAIDNAAFNVTETLTANPAAGGIVAGSFGAGALDAAALAADAGTEIAAAVWDRDATLSQAQGSFGQAMGDPVLDTNTIYKAVVTDATGATVGVDVVAVKAETASIQADTDNVQTRLPTLLVGGRMDSDVGAMQAGTVTAAAIANGAIDAATFAAGAIDAAAIATGAIDADAIALSAADEILGSVSGTADSGSTTTVVDTERTEADTDYWKGSLILFTSGTLNGQCRLVTAFNAATDTITFAPATTVAVLTHTYRLLPFGRVDVHFWLGVLANALISGRVDTSVGAMAANVIAAAATAADFLAEINAEVADVMKTDTTTEPSQAAPTATPTMQEILTYLYVALRDRNDIDTVSGFKEFYNDAGTVIFKKAMTDAGGIYSEAKAVIGP